LAAVQVRTNLAGNTNYCENNNYEMIVWWSEEDKVFMVDGTEIPRAKGRLLFA